jgi:tRNA modification GTPase
MLVEATLDFPEEELDPLDRADARRRLSEVRGALANALARARQGSILRSGLSVVLAGQPNVGKSSLLNRLAGEDLAIVTAIPGTTRDTVRQTIQIDGIPLNIVDTAGLREARDEVEQIGIARTWSEIERADLLLLIVDARTGITSTDESIVARIPARLARLVVHNKLDLVPEEARFRDTDDAAHVFASAKTGAGFDQLKKTLLGLAGWEPSGESVYMARERHLDALRQAGKRLAAAEGVFAESELLAEELRLAQRDLEGVTGRFTADDLLGEIFARFCIGK